MQKSINYSNSMLLTEKAVSANLWCRLLNKLKKCTSLCLAIITFRSMDCYNKKREIKAYGKTWILCLFDQSFLVPMTLVSAPNHNDNYHKDMISWPRHRNILLLALPSASIADNRKILKQRIESKWSTTVVASHKKKSI